MNTDDQAMETEADRVLDLVEEALDRGDPQEALRLCEEVLDTEADHAGALFLAGEAHRDLRELEEAEARYRRVMQINPSHSASWSGLATVLFDQLRFDDAHAALQRAVRLDPENSEAYYWRAMLRERRSDFKGAERDFRRAARLDPEQFPMPVSLDDAMVEAVVEESVRELHPSIREYLKQVAILLEEVPDEETCGQWDPPAPPGEILGYFSGYSLLERSVDNPWSALPSAIVLFRRNLGRLAWDRERLVEELRITVFHEVGHFLGLDEDDLEERGLD
jgi:predicted Zn-dependent protease with MMP-like domain